MNTFLDDETAFWLPWKCPLKQSINSFDATDNKQLTAELAQMEGYRSWRDGLKIIPQDGFYDQR